MPTSSVTSLSFSPSGESLVMLCDDNTFHVWNVDVSRFTRWWGESPSLGEDNENEDRDIVTEAWRHIRECCSAVQTKCLEWCTVAGLEGGAEASSNRAYGAVRRDTCVT